MIFPPVLAFAEDYVSPKGFTLIALFRGWRVDPNSIFGKGQKDWFYPDVYVLLFLMP
jgi:hypothetical protein